jgi:hypothetical protein
MILDFILKNVLRSQLFHLNDHQKINASSLFFSIVNKCFLLNRDFIFFNFIYNLLN